MDSPSESGLGGSLRRGPYRLAFVALAPTSPPRDGVSTIITNIVDGLHRRGHKLHLIAVRRHDDSGELSEHFQVDRVSELRLPEPRHGIVARLERRVGGIATGVLPWMWDYRTPEVRKWLIEQLRADDSQAFAVMANAIAPALAEGRIPGKHGIWFRFSLSSEDARAADAGVLTSWLCHRFDRNQANRYEMVAACTPVERDIQRKLTPNANVTWLPFGIRVPEPFTPPVKDGIPTLLFIADWNYPPNVDGLTPLLGQVMPRVWLTVPTARVVLAGSRSTSIDGISEDPRVVVHGTYGKLEDLVSEATVAILPLRIAQGVRNRVFEILGACIPLVATSNAVTGLDPRENEVALSDDWDGFADAAAAALSSAEVRDGLRRGGIAFLRRFGDMDRASEAWENAFAGLIERG